MMRDDLTLTLPLFCLLPVYLVIHYSIVCFFEEKLYCTCHLGSVVVRVFASGSGGTGFKPHPGQYSDWLSTVLPLRHIPIRPLVIM